MTLINAVLVLTALSTVLGVLNPHFLVKVSKCSPFIHITRKHARVTIPEWVIIVIIIIGCIKSINDQKESAIEKTKAITRADSLFKVTNTLQKANDNHLTKVKDSLNRKIDTLLRQNYQLSQQQYKSFDSTYRKIKGSADTLNSYITGKGGYCYALFSPYDGKQQLMIKNPFKFGLRGGYLKITPTYYSDSIRKIKAGRFGYFYSAADEEKFTKDIPFESIPHGITSFNYTIETKPGVIQCYEIIVDAGSEVVALQLVFFASNNLGSAQVCRRFVVRKGRFVLAEEKNMQGAFNFVDWGKWFPLPINRMRY